MTKIVTLLLDLQAGCTAIQLAAASGFLNIATILLAHGAKAENRDLSVIPSSKHLFFRNYFHLVFLFDCINT
jgi:hypothetical protein